MAWVEIKIEVEAPDLTIDRIVTAIADVLNIDNVPSTGVEVIPLLMHYEGPRPCLVTESHPLSFAL